VFGLGVATGLTYFGGTLYWVAEVIGNHGGLPYVVGVLIGVLLASYLALYPAVVALLVWAAVRRFGGAGIWLAPAFWVAAEWVRSSIGGGFPWVLLGSSQASVIPVVQLASLTGVFGLSALVALVGTAAAAVTLSRGRGARVGAGSVALLLVAVVAWGAWRASAGTLAAGPAVRVGLVQGSIPQDQKWDPAHRDEILRRYLDLSRRVIEQGAEIVIWPEASTPFFFDLDTVLASPIRRLAAETDTPLLIGTDQVEVDVNGGPDRYYNSAVLVDGDGRTRGSYRKMQLVPFGEYVPLKSLLFFVGPLVEAVSDFSAGDSPVVLEAGGRRISVAICYESVYPWIARAFVANGSQLLATITNDAWFGRSSAAYQHFEQGAIRAVEQARYVVRAANTGISGAVDPYGRVLSATPLFVTTTSTVDVHLLQSRTIYSRTGDVVAWASLAVTGWIGLVMLRKP
jgi:apolipoprotein N-acyltransferase